MDQAKAVATQCCSSRESVRSCFDRAALVEMRNLRGEASGLVPEEVHERHSRPSPLVIYGWLPKKSNCRLCGEHTCLAFAAQLITGGKQLHDCPVIWEPGKEDVLESLKELLGVLV